MNWALAKKSATSFEVDDQPIEGHKRYVRKLNFVINQYQGLMLFSEVGWHH